jgi:hypothetical protein
MQTWNIYIPQTADTTVNLLPLSNGNASSNPRTSRTAGRITKPVAAVAPMVRRRRGRPSKADLAARATQGSGQ